MSQNDDDMDVKMSDHDDFNGFFDEFWTKLERQFSGFFSGGEEQPSETEPAEAAGEAEEVKEVEEVDETEAAEETDEE